MWSLVVRDLVAPTSSRIDILVKYDNNTYGTIPVALVVIKASDKWGNWVDDSSSIKIEDMRDNRESTQQPRAVLVKQSPWSSKEV